MFKVLANNKNLCYTEVRFITSFEPFHLPEKVREELSSVVGNRQVQFKDRTELPFTNAVIHETQRLTAVAALGLPHRTSQDITFRGHFIKKVKYIRKQMMCLLYIEA